MLHVAYKGGGPALAAVVAGETSVYFTPIATGMPHIRSGKLRPLGVSAPKRVAELPAIPAIAEMFPGYEMLSWAGLMVPAKTPQAIVDAIHKAAVSAVNSPEISKRLNSLGYIVVGSRPEALAAYIKTEIDKYAKLIRQIGLPPQ
jgi:tripartite-type tricarboxylate transporter receptor subunit TctC